MSISTAHLVSRLLCTTLAACLALGLFPGTAAARVDGFRVGTPEISFGSIEFDVPDGWSVTDPDPKTSDMRAIRLDPPGEKPFLFRITPLPLFEAAGSFRRCVDLYSLAREMRDDLLPISEEREMPLQDLRGPHVCGFYAFSTDRRVETPTLEDFKYGTFGYAVSGHAMLSFTIFTNLQDPPESATALEILRSARHVGLPTSASSAMAGVRLAFPGKSWGLTLDLDGFELRDAESRQGPGTRIDARHDALGLMVTVFLEQDFLGAPAEQYRRWYRDRNFPSQDLAPPNDVPEAERKDGRSASAGLDFVRTTDLEESERNGIPLLERSVSIAAGCKQKHMNAFLVHDGVWIDVHLSKACYEAADRERFNRILDSLKIAP